MRLAHLTGPPWFGIVDLELRKLLGDENDFAIFVRRQLDRLLEANSGGSAGNQAFDCMIARVVQLGVDGQVRCVERLIKKMRNCQRRTHRDRAGRKQIDRAREAHVLIRRRGIPVDPVDAQVLFRGREGLHGQHIHLAWFQELRYIKVIGAIGSGNLSRVRDSVAVQPDFAAVVDATEMKPESRFFLRCGRRGELSAIPPAAAVGALLRHG